jgi:hypothetical protein
MPSKAQRLDPNRINKASADSMLNPSAFTLARRPSAALDCGDCLRAEAHGSLDHAYQSWHAV